MNERLEAVERTTADFTETDTNRRERQVMSRLHPECERNETTDLYIVIRRYNLDQVILSYTTARVGGRVACG
jgi:hypothetical protein